MRTCRYGWWGHAPASVAHLRSWRSARGRAPAVVDAHNRGAGLLGVAEGREHPGVVGAGVLAKDKDGVSLLEVFEGDGALADADDVEHMPLDSWHMLEQSGRLLVPSGRFISW